MCEFMKWDTGAQKQWYSCFTAAFPNPCDVGKKRTSLPCLLISCLSVTGCQIEEQCEDEGRLFTGDSGVHSCHFPAHHVSAIGCPQAIMCVCVCLYEGFYFRSFLGRLGETTGVHQDRDPSAPFRKIHRGRRFLLSCRWERAGQILNKWLKFVTGLVYSWITAQAGLNKQSPTHLQFRQLWSVVIRSCPIPVLGHSWNLMWSSAAFTHPPQGLVCCEF